MKIISRSSDLPDRLLTPLHRQWFDKYFGGGLKWYAPEIGSQYTVHGLYIIRGYPYYWLRVPERPNSSHKYIWQMYPSVCFDVIDSRISKFWETKIGTSERQGDQFFSAMFGVHRWVHERGFWDDLVDGKQDAHDYMMVAGNCLDAEFE